jgi:hypothetical protein
MPTAKVPSPPERLSAALTRAREAMNDPNLGPEAKARLERAVNLAEQRAIVVQAMAAQRAKLGPEKTANPMPKDAAGEKSEP